MSGRARSRAAWTVWAMTLAAMAGAIGLLILNRLPKEGGLLASYALIAVISMSFATSGALISSRTSRNPIGWLLAGLGLIVALAAFSEQYVLRGLVMAPGSLAAVGFVAWLGNWVQPAIIGAVPVIFMLFPTGKVRSRRWRWVLWATVAALVMGVLGTLLFPGHEDGMTNSLKDAHLHLVNPTGIRSAQGIFGALLAVAGLGGLIAALLAVVSLVLRYRNADGEEREQIKWLAFVAVGTVVLVVMLGFIGSFLQEDSPLGSLLWVVTLGFPLLGIPAAVTIAVLKYRLYDIDVVINKTLVYGLLAGFITAVYVGIVVGIGALIGSRAQPNLGLSILATAVVAVAFQPVRSWVQRFANRLVYGKRATPYEVLSEFSERMAGTYAAEDLPPRMARILAEGTGAQKARVWLRVGRVLKCEAAWPGTADAPEPLSLPDEGLPAFPGATSSYPVHHRGELLGALTLSKAPGDRLTPAEGKLAADLAAQAGLVLRNVRLTEELLARLEELRASRQRIVAAQDSERRRLERNIHDGAQQQLVALAVKLRLARTLLGKDPPAATRMLDEVAAETGQALEDLRDLARGIYPPLLADRGLVAALQAQTRKVTLPVSVAASGSVGRYPQETEAAVYFCVLEALQNVAKYARATAAEVRMGGTNGTLTFTVSDDGVGFDPAARGYGTGMQGMADRLSALGGDLQVESEPGRGTVVRGTVPVG